MAESESFGSSIPAWFQKPAAIVDTLETETSRVQKATVNECIPLLGAVNDPSRNPFDFNEFGLPSLSREDHISFLQENLEEFPPSFVGLDASRPWMVYWALVGLYMLGEDVSSYRSR